MIQILEILSIISTFVLGILCFRASRNSLQNSVILFWIGFNFMIISVVRILGFFKYINLEETRAIIGVFYPFILTIVLIETKKIKK